MKSKLGAVLIAAMIISFQTLAVKAPNGKDPLEVTYIKSAKADLHYQDDLRKSEAWQLYLQKHRNWSVEFNEATQTPHIAYGKPISVIGINAREVAENFISENLGSWISNPGQLELQSINFSGKYHNVIFKQVVNGIEVLNSRVHVKLSKDLKVVKWGADFFRIVLPLADPVMDANQSIDKAKAGIASPASSAGIPVLKILPVPVGREVEIKLVYEINISVNNHSGLPANYYTLVDADNGEIVYRQNRVKNLAPSSSDVNISSTVYKLNPFVAPLTVPLSNLKTDNGGNILFTDSLGDVFLAGTNPIAAEFSLEGLWSKVITDTGNSAPKIMTSLPSGQSNLSFDSVTSIRHTSGYYHVNIIHDFMKSFFPSFTTMDFPLPTRIDVAGGFCNAYWSGADINFFETGGGCNCMSQIADVVYHEYGHGINDLFYSSMSAVFQNGALHEGYSDVWAFSITQQSTIGIGNSVSNPNDYIRRYDVNRKVYPQDLVGQSHSDGEIIAGAWYDVAMNTNWATMTGIFSETYFDLINGQDGNEGVIFSEILLAALFADDNDADLSNGTPNDQQIIEAFDLHGISLINNSSFVHAQILAASSSMAIEVTAELYSQIPFLPTHLQLHYRIGNSGSYSVLPMNVQAGVTYSASIPAQPVGTVVSYFVKLIDSTSMNTISQPSEVDTIAGNIPYFILVDCLRDRIEDFDANLSAGWQLGIPGDSATGGIWLIAAPVPSVASGDTCQAGVQHTPGGVNCAVTGNAPFISSPNYNADVDNGKTTLQSPPIDIQASIDPVVSYWRWFTNDQGSNPRNDYWRTYASDDGLNFVLLEEAIIPDHGWRRFAFKVSDYFSNATAVTLRFVAEDINPASVVESAIDDIEIFSSVLNAGLEDVQSSLTINVYPNPVSENLNLEVSARKSSQISLEVVNILGEKVGDLYYSVSSGMNRLHLSVANLENGIYYLRIKDDQTNLSKAFSVIR